MTTAPQDLAARLDRLERSNARLRAALGVVALAGAALVLGGQDRPKVSATKFDRVEVKSLVLVDAKGRTRAELGTDDRGRTGLKVVAAGGERSAFVGLDSGDDACVLLRNGAGMAQVILALDESKGSAAVVMCNTAGEPRASTTVAKDGTPLIGLYDGRDGYRASLSVLPDGAPYLKLDDTAGTLEIHASPSLEYTTK